MGRRSRRAGCTGIIATVLVVLLAVAGVLTTTSSSPSAAAATANGASTHVYDGAPNNASPRPVVEQVPVSADHRIDSRASPSPRTALALAASLVAAEGGSEVLLDTSAVKAQSAARSLMKPGECAVICSTVEREAAQQGFSTAGLPVVDDGTSAVLRSQVAQQLRGFGAATQGLENDAIIGATALERGIPLITGDRALWNAILKLGGDARWFAPGM